MTLARLPVAVAFSFAALLLAALPAQTPTHTFHGLAANDRFGWSSAGAGDVNADGYDDVIVGAVLHDSNGSNAGMARVLSGLDGSVLYTFYGDSPGDQFGYSVDGAGDVNADGHADLIVGAVLADTANGVDSGLARVFSGADGAVLFTFLGDVAGDRQGQAVNAVGDVNGDGWDDLVVSAYWNGTNGSRAGMARVYSGRDGTVLHTFLGDSGGDRFGAQAAGVGDVNADGFDDVGIGAPMDDNNGTSSGMVRVYSGVDGAVLHVFDGAAAGDNMSRVAGATDLNGDGHADILVGAWGDDTNGNDSGLARVYSGADGSVVHTLYGYSATARFGYKVGGAGDVNGDGVGDLIVGAPLDDTGHADAGMARVFDGSNGRTLYTIRGEAAGDEMGQSVAFAGDINGDGFADVILGAHLTDTAGSDAGSAYVYALAPLEGDLLYSPSGLSTADDFGRSVSFAGDVNADGYPDMVVGAPRASGSVTSSGIAQVFSGLDGAVLYTFEGDVSNDSFGEVVSGAGDVNNDGYDDVIIGAPDADTARGADSGMARVFSGQTGTVLYTLNGNFTGSRLGSSVAGLEDLNGDGHPDLVVNSSHSVMVYSGVDGSLLRGILRRAESVGAAGDVDADGIPDVVLGGVGIAWVYSFAYSSSIPLYTITSGFRGFGNAVDGAGDMNNDGYDDVIVGAYQTGFNAEGSAQVFSGINGTLLHDFYVGIHDGRLGSSVSCAGDVDRNGYDDVIVGAPGLGRAYIYSGLDGSVLLELSGGAIDEHGASVGGGVDVDRDGLVDFIVGAPGDGTSSVGVARVFTSRFRSDGGILRTFGPACPGANGNLPRIGYTGRAVIGGSFEATLRAVPPFAPAIVAIGLVPQTLNLGGFGMTGCTGLTQPITTIFTLANAAGRASFTQPVPNNSGLLGLPPHFQWFVFDPGANPAGLIASNGLLGVLGNP